MRAGAVIRTAHKEGGTTLSCEHGVFTRRDHGESDAVVTFRDERAFLAVVREHLRPPVSHAGSNAGISEQEAWRTLVGQLETDGAGVPGTRLGATRAAAVWGMVVAASLVLLGARARAELRDRDLAPSIEALTLPAAVVLALCVLVAAVWLRRHWR